jgi:hypothetical protein
MGFHCNGSQRADRRHPGAQPGLPPLLERVGATPTGRSSAPVRDRAARRTLHDICSLINGVELLRLWDRLWLPNYLRRTRQPLTEVRHPTVAEAAVVGATDPTTGQGSIVAFVILRGTQSTEDLATTSPRIANWATSPC